MSSGGPFRESPHMVLEGESQRSDPVIFLQFSLTNTMTRNFPQGPAGALQIRARCQRR